MSRTEAPGPIPATPMSQQDTEPLEMSDAEWEAKRLNAEAAMRELAELQRQWASQSPGTSPIKPEDEDPTLVVDRKRVQEWLESEEKRR